MFVRTLGFIIYLTASTLAFFGASESGHAIRALSRDSDCRACQTCAEGSDVLPPFWIACPILYGKCGKHCNGCCA
uniref:Uncharacterized protein n=1 Tax=Perkinsus chesapeaki TaxID=330153 RepID=A7YXP4_PERCH|nr:unknown [Perkinsus chesapeaki]